jgi:hypothetical protein
MHLLAYTLLNGSNFLRLLESNQYPLTCLNTPLTKSATSVVALAQAVETDRLALEILVSLQLVADRLTLKKLKIKKVVQALLTLLATVEVGFVSVQSELRFTKRLSRSA